MLKAVIFDFDGVIVDSEQLHYQAFDEIFRPLSVHISVNEYFERFVGMTDEELFRLIDKERNLRLGEEKLQELFRLKAVTFKLLASRQAKIYDGIPQFLKMLFENKIPLAINSGALFEEIEMILKGARLIQFFEVIVSSEQVKHGKPDPEGFLLALSLLNKKLSQPVNPQDCIVIEDSHWGLEAAHSACMHSIAITNTYSADNLNPADKIVANLSELTLADLQALCR